MQIYKKIREKVEKYNGFFLIALPAAIALIYLGCVRIHDLDDVLYYLYPACIKGLMILLGYLAWRCYRKERVPVIVSILLSGLAVILPFAEENQWFMVRAYYWNHVIFFCFPVLLLFLVKMLENHIPEGRPHDIQKRSLLYFLIVLLFIYLITNIGLNFAVEAFKYDVADGFYMLVLADIIFWKELYAGRKTGSRVKGAVFAAGINIGMFIFLLIENRRLREVFYDIGSALTGGRADLQADWLGYRRAAFEAFLSKDLTVLDQAYRQENYMYSVYGSGLTAIRFRCGILPVFAMAALLILLVIFLWNWNRSDLLLGKCARCLAVGYLLQMTVAFILQANMVTSPYLEFPFTGMHMAEIMLPALLVYESSHRVGHG